MRKRRAGSDSARDRASDYAQLLLASEGLEQEVTKLRKKWRIPPGGYTAGEVSEPYGEIEPEFHKKFDKEIQRVLEKLGILPLWDRWVAKYVIFNDTSNPPVQKFRIDLPDSDESGELVIRIQKDTTLDDIEEAWPLITRWRERLPTRSTMKAQPFYNLRRDLQVWEFHRQGLTNTQVANRLEKQGYTLSYSDVAKILQRIRKRLP